MAVVSADLLRRKPVVADCSTFADSVSPFGLQALRRDSLQILKSDRINRLAMTLAIYGTPAEILDDSYVAGILQRRPDWQEEYHVVHLIEKSLWIDGRSDLLMTLTRNPSQIPDNPPQVILDALAKSYALHPEATTWYGVPLFSDQLNSDGLPIPMTAQQVREEARTRIQAAQTMALKWRWLYRGMAAVAHLPMRLWGLGSSAMGCVRGTFVAFQESIRQARRDMKIRARAAAKANMEYCKMGEQWTVVPEHSTFIGRFAEKSVESIRSAQEIANSSAPAISGLAIPLGASALVPLLTAAISSPVVPLTIVSCDPFLFVELPEEPGKFRHIGHWYWQRNLLKKKLHVHA